MKWSQEEERELVASTLVAVLRDQGKTASAVYEYRKFASYMELAQMFLPVERRRIISSYAQADWLRRMVEASIPDVVEPPKVVPPTPAQVADFVAANLDAVLDELRKTYVIAARQDCVGVAAARGKKLAAPRPPKILICGTLPAQAASLAAEFGDSVSLTFRHSGYRHNGNALPKVDHAIGLISFMSHSEDAHLHREYKQTHYHRVIGGMEAVKRIVTKLIDNNTGF